MNLHVCMLPDVLGLFWHVARSKSNFKCSGNSKINLDHFTSLRSLPPSFSQWFCIHYLSKLLSKELCRKNYSHNGQKHGIMQNMYVFILISYLGLLNIWLKASLENMFKKVKLIKPTFAFINQQQRALFPKFIYFDDALWQRSTYWIIFIEWTSLDFWGSRLPIWDLLPLLNSMHNYIFHQL